MGNDADSSSLTQHVWTVLEQSLSRCADAETVADVQNVRRDAFGKVGSLLQVKRAIGSLPVSDRKSVGSAVAQAEDQLKAALDSREQQLLELKSQAALFDVTLPSLPPMNGGLHPTIQLMYDLNDAFAALNFEVFDGPRISSELFEFDHLNFPPNHPARESMDTFWLKDSGAGNAVSERLSLRPHLTGASIRFMLDHEPPFRFVYPGAVYRNESTDARHERAFFQYEALLIDRRVPFTAGKFMVDTVLGTVFGRHVNTRMRTGFFPFVEPGFEIDMECQVCHGGGCRTCRYVGWLEIMPGGVPHPNVLKAGGLDPDEWTGFYVNVGLDRLVMMRYGIDDVRLFHSADLRFLNQFT